MGDDRLRGGRGGVGGFSLVDGGAAPPADAESVQFPGPLPVATVLTCAWTDGSQAGGEDGRAGLPDRLALVQCAGDPPLRLAVSPGRGRPVARAAVLCRGGRSYPAPVRRGWRSCAAAAARPRPPVRRGRRSCIAAAARPWRRRAAQVGDQPLVGEDRGIPPRGRERVADLRERAAAPLARSFEQDVRVLPGRHAGSLVPGRRRSGAHPRGRDGSTL